MIKITNHYILSIGTKIIYMDGQCLRSYIKVTLGGLKKHLNSMKIKTKYNENSDKGYFLEIDVQYLENLQNLHNDLPFFREGMKI